MHSIWYLVLLAFRICLTHTKSLNNENMDITFGMKGLASIQILKLNKTFAVIGDNFIVGINGTMINSAALPIPTSSINSTHAVFMFFDPISKIKFNVVYELREFTAFVTKEIILHHSSSIRVFHNITEVNIFDDTMFKLQDGPSSHMSVVTKSQYGFGDTALFQRFGNKIGIFFSAQNPFLTTYSNTKGAVTISYQPYFLWNGSTSFSSDLGLVGIYSLTGRILSPPAPHIDEAEQSAMVEAVRQFITVKQSELRTVKIHIPWTENDYQLDIYKAADREQYKRIIDRCSQLGITHLLFSPRNSEVTSDHNNTDAWRFEEVLWFGMGQRLRLGMWYPGDPLPESLLEMLDYMKKKNVKPVAYVYPILAFLAGTLPGGANPPWIINGTYYQSGKNDDYNMSSNQTIHHYEPLRSSLVCPEFQNWLVDTMVAFAKATGAGGFSFDYTYFEQKMPVASIYSQWHGWRSILKRLHTAKGGLACGGEPCVVDNRQNNHQWGVWMWVMGGTYAEPLMSDEAPESWMFYEADLYTDHLSANRERFTAWNYRNLEFCPSETLPGFAFHQTDRDPTPAAPDARHNQSRTRDFDLMGYRYSLLSSIGSAGLNNVINMLPARNLSEFKYFPSEDISFIQQWFQWTDDNIDLLKLTKTLPQQPSQGKIDGTYMIRNNEGNAFLYNPSAREINISLTLGASLGFICAQALPIYVRYLGSSMRGDAHYNLDVINCGEILYIMVPATTAVVLGFEQWGCVIVPQLIGARGDATINRDVHSLILTNVQGEAGITSHLMVAMAPGTPTIKNLTINGINVNVFKNIEFHDVPAVVISGRFVGKRFAHSQEIGTIDGFTGGRWTAKFLVPSAAITQLKKRNTTYPIMWNLNPAYGDESAVSWLAPGRLLIFIKYKPLVNDSFNVSGDIDNISIHVRKAYNTIIPKSNRFIGYFSDVTDFIKPGQEQMLTLNLPKERDWLIQSGALAVGNDLTVIELTKKESENYCKSDSACIGFTFAKPDGSITCTDVKIPTKMYFKTRNGGNDDKSWCKVVKPSTIDGIFFNNIETIYTTRWAQ